MATRVGDEIVKSPRELVISAYATMPDITKVVTPDIKNPGRSQLIFIEIAGPQARLGGSALAQVYGQVGNESPDVDDPEMLKRAFHAIQKLISENLILAGHDVSDGGVITTFLEMAFAGNCGLRIRMDGSVEPPGKALCRRIGGRHRVSREGRAGRSSRYWIRFVCARSMIGETTEEKKIEVTYHSAEGSCIEHVRDSPGVGRNVLSNRSPSEESPMCR